MRDFTDPFNKRRKLMNIDPVKTAKRQRKRQERFGTLTPVCVLCGCDDLVKLAAVTVGWLSRFQMHHVVGRNHDPELVVPICLNCHRGVAEGLAQAGVSMDAIGEPRERVALMLDALSTFFELLVEALRRWAASLRACDSKES
jgi:hypothetical protein